MDRTVYLFMHFVTNIVIKLRFGNALPFVSYLPIWDSALVYYQATTEQLQWTSTIYTLTYVILAPLFNYLVLRQFNFSLKLS